MSLINTMLRDLEQRRTEQAASAISGLSGSQVASAGAGRGNRALWLGLGVSLLVVAFLLGERQFAQAPLPADRRVVSMVTEAVPAPRPVAVVAAKPVVVAQPSAPAVPPGPALVTEPVSPGPDARPTLTETGVEVDSPNAGQAAASVAVAAVVAESPAPAAIGDAEAGDPQPPAQMKKQVRPLSARQRASLSLKAAVAALEHDDNQTAIARLNDSLREDPSLIIARETLAALYINAGRLAEAAELLRAGLQREPRNTSLAMMYARLLADQGRLPEALSVLEQARPGMKDNLRFHALLAAFYQRAGLHRQAVSIYRDAVKHQPRVASWWLGLGVSLEALGGGADGDPREALDAYRHAYQGGGLNAEVRSYVRSRIEVLTALVPDAADSGHADGADHAAVGDDVSFFAAMED